MTMMVGLGFDDGAALIAMGHKAWCIVNSNYGDSGLQQRSPE
jgi:hypothetical protein